MIALVLMSILILASFFTPDRLREDAEMKIYPLKTSRMRRGIKESCEKSKNHHTIHNWTKDNHVENGDDFLARKSKVCFSAAVEWYSRYRSRQSEDKPHVYLRCMKSGEVTSHSFGLCNKTIEQHNVRGLFRFQTSSVCSARELLTKSDLAQPTLTKRRIEMEFDHANGTNKSGPSRVRLLTSNNC